MRKKVVVGGVIGAIVVVLFVAAQLTIAPVTHFGPPKPAANQNPGQVQIVTVQMHWRMEDYESRGAFRNRIEGLIREGLGNVDQSNPTLMVFPEDVGSPLTMMNVYSKLRDKETLPSAAKAAISHEGLRVFYYTKRFNVSPIRALALSEASLVGETYVSTFSELAREYGIYIIAGSAPLPDFAFQDDGNTLSYAVHSGNVYNTCYFFGPDGRVIGRQKKVHLIPLESTEGLDLTPGRLSDLKVFDTVFGKIGIAICYDAFHEDVLDRLKSLGADVLVQPSANPEVWSVDQQKDWLNGCWLALQKYPQFRIAINPMMTGKFFDLRFEGQSSVVVADDPAPRLTYSKAPVPHGFTTLAKGQDTEEVLVTRLKRTKDDWTVEN